MTTPSASRSRLFNQRFYFILAAAMALIVVVGFTPSLYLRFAFERPHIASSWVWVHGVLNTSWMALLMVQTHLVSRRRVVAHRTLGITGVGIAGLLVAVGVYVTLDQMGREAGALAVGHITTRRVFSAASLVSMLPFAGFVTAATLLRRQSELHKRLMVFATLLLVTAAVIRFPVFVPPSLVIGLFLVLMAINDRRIHGRVLRVTWWGVVIIATGIVLSVLFAASSAYDTLALALASAR